MFTLRRIIYLIIILLITINAVAKTKKQQHKKSNITPAQLRLDSIRNRNLIRIDSIRTATKQKQDSLKMIREARRDSLNAALKAKQKLAASKRPKKVLPITQELNGGISINSNGWGVYAERGVLIDEGDIKKMLWVEFSEIYSPKEKKQLNENFSILNPNEPKPLTYKYGKINNFYQFKIGYLRSKQLSGILDKKNIVLHWVMGAGLSLGLVKPYYLDLLYPEANGTYTRKFEKYTDVTKSIFLDERYIIGGGNFTNGIGEIQLQPGLILKNGIYFDYKLSKYSFVGLEIGMSIEAYTKKIEIMATTKNNALFFTIYSHIKFGKRWE